MGGQPWSMRVPGSVWMPFALVAPALLCLAIGVARAQDAAKPGAEKMMAKDADPDWEVATVKASDPNDTDTGFHLKGSRINIERKTVETMLLLG